MSAAPPPRRTNRAANAAVLLLLAAVAGGLAWGVLSLPDASAGLADLVGERLDESGVGNPVTAVLLNFRSYDTFLELVVLVLAVIGAWSLYAEPTEAEKRKMAAHRPPSPGVVLNVFVHVAVPVILVVSGYVLWAGGHAPGGAFQAGAVIGAGGVLLIVSGVPVAVRIRSGTLRPWIVLAPAIFLGIGLAATVAGRAFLQYPDDWAYQLILIIEAASAISIGVILATLFAARPPRDGTHTEPPRTT